MLDSNDSRKDGENGTDLDGPNERTAAPLPFLNEALALVPGCRNGSSIDLEALGSILGLIIPHLPDGFGRATLERAHLAFCAETPDPLFVAGLVERAAATLHRLQKDHIAMHVARALVSATPRAAEP